MPDRIQRQRVAGYRQPPGTVYVGRPTRWGNPWRIDEQRGVYNVALSFELLHQFPVRPIINFPGGYAYRSIAEAQAVLRFHHHLGTQPDEWVREWLAPLRHAKHLSCWCPVGSPCHGDELVAQIERLWPEAVTDA